jgi:hypothetical protein
MFSDTATLTSVPIPLSGGKKRMAWPVCGCRNSTVASHVCTHPIQDGVYIAQNRKKSLAHTKYAKNCLLFKVCTQIRTKKSYHFSSARHFRPTRVAGYKLQNIIKSNAVIQSSSLLPLWVPVCCSWRSSLFYKNDTQQESIPGDCHQGSNILLDVWKDKDHTLGHFWLILFFFWLYLGKFKNCLLSGSASEFNISEIFDSMIFIPLSWDTRFFKLLWTIQKDQIS